MTFGCCWFDSFTDLNYHRYCNCGVAYVVGLLSGFSTNRILY